MDPNLRIAQEYRFEHRHGDGSWSPMEPRHHDAASHDAERSWPRRLIFRCGGCDEVVTVTVGVEESDPGSR